MISEVDKIQKGLVEATVEFNTQRKVIGVATTNLLPNENGIVPLSKQGAFQVVEQTVETLDLTNAMDEVQTPAVEETMEQVDLPVLDETQEQTGPTLQEPVHNDVITNSPVNVENPQDLSGFTIPEPVVEEEPAIMEPVGPKIEDIQMPQMPETIVANEPETLDENMFESLSTPVEMQTVQTEVPTLTQSEEILSSIPTAQETTEQPPMFEPAAEDNSVQENVNIEIPTMPENSELTATEEPEVEELNPVQEPIKEDIQETPNIPEILDIDKIIETNRQTLLAYADELIKAATQIKEFVNKSFDEINVSINDIKNSKDKTPSESQNVITAQVNEMVSTGNNLVDDAISRINAIAEQGPKL